MQRIPNIFSTYVIFILTSIVHCTTSIVHCTNEFQFFGRYNTYVHCSKIFISQRNRKIQTDTTTISNRRIIL